MTFITKSNSINVMFKYIPNGKVFNYNGSKYVKMSTRTARLVDNTAIWFYFSPKYICSISIYTEEKPLSGLHCQIPANIPDIPDIPASPGTKT